MTVARETWIQYVIESYQKLEKWYMTMPCLTQHYKLWIKGKVEQSRECCSALLTPQCTSY